MNVTVLILQKRRPLADVRYRSCLSDFLPCCKEKGLGSVIMGIFDEDKITELLEIPEERELAALIAVGWPDIDPEVPKRKSVDDLLQFR